MSKQGTTSSLKRQQADQIDQDTDKKVRGLNMKADEKSNVSESNSFAEKAETKIKTEEISSVSELKALFVFFGPIDAGKVHVYVEAYTGKVLFKYKSDAEVDLRSKGDHKFGNTAAHYTCIREYKESEYLQAPMQQQQLEVSCGQVQVQNQYRPQLKS
ncbi:uncharacterized protein A4U43_C03F30170 [Asparagus officinalis]|uniref:Uncharacterized protein n=1 Tax=Asparagus officinalis TaxID=4686 RepID=A0A5P1FEZ1_ASPOF|nr:uncharacterized protein A4U43_C03F30170 [Asparagus officinalis]